MEDNIHPVVELLLARMKSNPEEFDCPEGRWEHVFEMVREHGSDEERRAIEAARRPIYLDEAHRWMMDELLNGDERRAEAERTLMAANRTPQANAQLSAIANLGRYQNAAGTYATGAPLSLQNAVTGIGTATPSQPLFVSTSGQEAMRIQANGELEIGGEKLDAGMIRKMKKALGL
jgi:hypothetical protein